MKRFINTIVVELISIRVVDYGKSLDIKDLTVRYD